jgi:hypothetical protein
VATTGHSQIGEFVPSRRTIVFRGDKDAGAATEQRFENTLWKADCYLNPNRPQYGTWKFSRAGWAPGDVVWPWWIDLTNHIRPGKTAALRYEPQPYDFGDDPKAPAQKEIDKASHVVRAYLILYRAPGDTMPAPTLHVTGVAGKSNAAKAGVRKGDYLAAYDGKPVSSADDLRAAIQAAAAAGKEKITVVVYRGPQRLELEIGPGRMGVPEAQGRLGAGQFATSLTGAHEVFLVDDLSLAQVDPATFHGTTRMLEGSAAVGLGERWDLGVRQGFPDASFGIGGKYQFLGEPRLRAKEGSFSLAGTLAPALYLFDAHYGTDTIDGQIWSLDTSLVAGYRLGDNVMVYGGPFYAYHALDSDVTVNGIGRGFSGRGNRFGANLGLRFEWRYFALMVEGAWSQARWDGAQDDVVALGMSFAALWGEAKQ